MSTCKLTEAVSFLKEYTYKDIKLCLASGKFFISNKEENGKTKHTISA